MIYVASKTKHADKWIRLRASGWPIISTWIDEADENCTICWPDLWSRCIEETTRCTKFLIYAEQTDILKGAWLELGVAIATKTPLILGVGIEEYSIAKSEKIKCVTSIDHALQIMELK